MRMKLISMEEKNLIIEDLNLQLPIIEFNDILAPYDLWSSRKKEYYLVKKSLRNEITPFSSEGQHPLLHAGVYFGRKRKEFNLSLEALSLLESHKDIIIDTKYSFCLDSQQSRHFLYGKSVFLDEKTAEMLHPKIFAFDEYNDLIGIGKVVKEEDEWFIKPIVDLGRYLRKERTMFKK